MVVGGSYVGLEFAQMYRRFGAEVPVVEKWPRLAGREDEEVSEAIREILTGSGRFFLGLDAVRAFVLSTL